MAWSFRVGRLFGIDVRIHVVFVAIMAWLCIYAAVETGSLKIGLAFLFRLLVLFAFVLLHELGHSLAAQRRGIRVADITLWPLGGLARLEGYTEDPRTELGIAMAGPAVNLAFALVFWPLLLLAGSEAGAPSGILTWLIQVNLMLGLINLVPAFPMDGGRILRALAARWLPYLKATEIAVFIGRIVAIGAIGYELIMEKSFGAITIIALFVLWAGATELRAARNREALGSFLRWPRSSEDIIDGEVVSSRDASPDKGKGPRPPPPKDLEAKLKPHEREFLEQIRKYGKKGRES
jgi:stage IV sporulation protein FB